MARQGIDLLVVGASADLLYLIGYEGHESERMSVLALPRDGGPHYVVPGLEAPLLQNQRDLLQIIPWEETEDPAAKVAAVAGAAAVLLARPILPYALAFAAGAMIFVVAEELIPEAKRGSPDIAAMSLMVGFAVMMTLDVALG
jgi:Xaa-Pro aminopeptidase